MSFNRKSEIRKTKLSVILVVLVLVTIGPAWAAPFDLIICGLGGEAVYQEQFADWGTRLKRVLVEESRHPAKNVRLLTESGTEADGRSDQEAIRSTLEQWSDMIGDSDDLFIFLIGHGSARRNVAQLNIPGPDLSADDLDVWLRQVHARQITVVNSAPASTAFINALTGSGRIVCTSTRSVDERYATRFMEGFIQALEEQSADQDRDGRISVWEVCRQASSLTQAWYLGQGLIATEHALLDDNGDGRGSRLDLEIDPQTTPQENMDGKNAETCYLQDLQFPPGADPALVEAYRLAIQEVERLIAAKKELAPEVYLTELEGRLLRAARLHRQLRVGMDKE